MIKGLYIFLITLFILPDTNAQLAGGNISIANLNAVEEGDRVCVCFSIDIADGTAGKNRTYAFAPLLSDGNYSVSLPAVAVEGPKSKRRTWKTAEKQGEPAIIYAQNGTTVQYTASVQAQSWMHGGQLLIEGVDIGCCGNRTPESMLLAGKLHLYDEPAPREVINEFRRFRPRSIADSLSVIFPFVVPEAMFDPEDPFKMFEAQRGDFMIVYFRQSRHTVEKNYHGNDQTLLNLTAAVNMILDDASSQVERVVVAGFSSPEGSLAFNERLAFNRAVSVKKHLLETTALRNEQVWIHNGSVDWRGAQVLLERSEIEGKQELMAQMESIPVSDGPSHIERLEKLRQVNGGEPFRLMMEELFPQLRSAAFIKVYYSNRKDTSNL